MKNIEFVKIMNSAWDYIQSLSERTLALLAIVIMHIAFLPNMVAYLNGITDELPNLDTYLLILLALAILNLRSIISKDSVSIFVHSIGFIAQLFVLSVVLLK